MSRDERAAKNDSRARQQKRRRLRRRLRSLGAKARPAYAKRAKTCQSRRAANRPQRLRRAPPREECARRRAPTAKAIVVIDFEVCASLACESWLASDARARLPVQRASERVRAARESWLVEMRPQR